MEQSSDIIVLGIVMASIIVPVSLIAILKSIPNGRAQ